jgi:superfamily I DNA/RNA helicase
VAFTIYSDAEQEAVLADDSARLLVVAPPGSGKTWSAVRLVARDIDAGRVGPSQRVLILTFSRAARAQLDLNAQALTTEQRARAEISNYHSFFWQKIWQYRRALGLPVELGLATEAQHTDDVSRALARAGVAPPQTSQQRRDAMRDYAAGLEYTLDEGLPERFDGQQPDRLSLVAAELDAIHRAGRLHYDDMAYYMWRLIDGLRTLRELWAHKYPVVLLDEYQDASPLQAAIVARLAPPPHRVYAFADPLQMIYGWRDASPQRLDSFRAVGASEHTLRTLHRYRSRPNLQRWIEEVRDVLLGGRDRVTVARPAEVQVLRYNPALPERGRVYGAPARELYQLTGPISAAFADVEIRTIGVMTRRRSQIPVLARALSQYFVCGMLGDADVAADWLREWIAGFAAVATPGQNAARLLDAAQTVAPRHPLLDDLLQRICPAGIRTDRLREPRRSLAVHINRLIERCDTLAGAVEAARSTISQVVAGQDHKIIAWDRERTLRQALRTLPDATDDEARAQVEARILRLRFAAAGTPQRGLFLLSCHEGKGKEFDVAVLPFLSSENFGGDQESRQLLYVSLSRARKRILARVATGQVPVICERIGIV